LVKQEKKLLEQKNVEEAQKLLPQLKKGTLIISPDYEIPGLRLHQKITDKDRGIYIYKI